MRNFQDTFETRKRSFICSFSICMTVPLSLACFLPARFTRMYTSLRNQNKCKPSICSKNGASARGHYL